MMNLPGGDSLHLMQGPAGMLEVAAMMPRNGPASDLAVICHPHSLMGGSLQNKVVHSIARAHRDAGHLAVRFNFRGVGRSEGEYDAGIGESADLMAVITWARQIQPQGRLFLAGFSFGSFVAARSVAELVASGQRVNHLLLVAPAVGNFDFSAFDAFPSPLTVIIGEQDEVVSPEAMLAWTRSVTTSCRLVRVAETGHFFHGKLPEVMAAVATDIG